MTRVNVRNLPRHLTVLILLAGTALAVTPAGAEARSAAPVRPLVGGVFNPIRNVGDGKCLQPEGESMAEFAAIVQMPCATTGLAGLAQGWQQIRVGTNHYRFVNQLSGFCFDAFDGAFNGARLLQGTCVPISNEEFNTNTGLPNVVALESRVGFRNTGYCIDVPGALPFDGMAMQIYRCNGTLAQRWVVGFAG
ncbi:RICIN domain-containing protein [Krasilnikovia sp. MM14-A1004]|uniref:RICIN domain-containing protein n=1 Tax=Krasilnikovia sp. MM14-A1004 TaxID=3373541 RepID=UPI00399D104A